MTPIELAVPLSPYSLSRCQTFSTLAFGVCFLNPSIVLDIYPNSIASSWSQPIIPDCQDLFECGLCLQCVSSPSHLWDICKSRSLPCLPSSKSLIRMLCSREISGELHHRPSSRVTSSAYQLLPFGSIIPWALNPWNWIVL